MADLNREKLHIHLHVYDEELDVFTTPDDEPYYRAAAKFVTDRYNRYAALFKLRKSDHTIALMTLVDIAMRYQKEKDATDTAPYDEALRKLTAQIEKELEEDTTD